MSRGDTFKVIRFEAKEVRQLPRSETDFISCSKVFGVKLLAANILLGSDKIFYLTDLHMGSEMERFGIHSSETAKYLFNVGIENIKLDEAVYLGSALDFIHYESVVYTLAKYEFFLRSIPNLTQKNFILNEKMSKHTRDWLTNSIQEKFPQCQIILMNDKLIIEIKTLYVLTLNEHLINSNLHNMSAFIKTIIPLESNPARYASKILLSRKAHVFFKLKSRKPRNWRLFEWYAKCRGYEVFDPGSMKFVDVLEKMSKASKVVSYHGGALVNLFACGPGTKVTEIYSEWYADCFEQISRSCRLDYTQFYYEMKMRPDLIRTIYYLLFRLDKKAYIKHFRVRYRDFKKILE